MESMVGGPEWMLMALLDFTFFTFLLLNLAAVLNVSTPLYYNAHYFWLLKGLASPWITLAPYQRGTQRRESWKIYGSAFLRQAHSSFIRLRYGFIKHRMVCNKFSATLTCKKSNISRIHLEYSNTEYMLNKEHSRELCCGNLYLIYTVPHSFM